MKVAGILSCGDEWGEEEVKSAGEEKSESERHIRWRVRSGGGGNDDEKGRIEKEQLRQAQNFLHDT